MRAAGWLLAVALGGAAAAQEEAVSSSWYLERGTHPRPAPSPDRVVQTAQQLATLLRDGAVPGFYDGQFALVADRFDELVTIAADATINHVLRVMAVMAIQEAADGEPVARALEPLILPAEQEFGIDYQVFFERDNTDDEEWVRWQLAADLSQHARYALAKDGQPEQILAKIEVMKVYVERDIARLLDPSVRSETRLQVMFGRGLVFDIGYQYQQFDDYEHAAEWFGRLCRALPGHRDTAMAHYNLACISALTGRPDEAIEHLRAAHAVGFTDVAWMEEDGDLASLRERPDFQALAADMRNEPAAADGAAQGAPDARAPDGP